AKAQQQPSRNPKFQKSPFQAREPIAFVQLAGTTASAAYASFTRTTRRFTVSATYAKLSETATYTGHARGISGFLTLASLPPESSLPYLPNVVIGLLLVSMTSTRACPMFGKKTRP